MNLMKSLYLGSAAGLVVMSGAHAADLPLKAKAVEYVKVCSLYGAGFYYIPGTDTCIKLGGYMRADLGVNTNTIFQGNTSNQPGAQNRTGQRFHLARAIGPDCRHPDRDRVRRGSHLFRGCLHLDLGRLPGVRVGGSAYDGNPNGGVLGGQLGVFHAFIQFAGFTIGKAASQFSAPWGHIPETSMTVLSAVAARYGCEPVHLHDRVRQRRISFDRGAGSERILPARHSKPRDSAARQRHPRCSTPFFGPVPYDTPQLGYGLSAYGGTTFPDIVGQLRVDQAWGMFQASLAGHHNNPAYYTGVETGGGPGGKWGWAGQGALTIKNIPTGPGDVINISGVYTNGATRYNIQDMTALAGANLIYGGSGISSVGFGFAPEFCLCTQRPASTGLDLGHARRLHPQLESALEQFGIRRLRSGQLHRRSQVIYVRCLHSEGPWCGFHLLQPRFQHRAGRCEPSLDAGQEPDVHDGRSLLHVGSEARRCGESSKQLRGLQGDRQLSAEGSGHLDRYVPCSAHLVRYIVLTIHSHKTRGDHRRGFILWRSQTFANFGKVLRRR